MQSVTQMQVAVEAVQDRLTLRVATSGNEEIRIYFTRRFLREVWPPLVHTLHRLTRPKTTAPQESARPATALNDGSFEQPFRADNPIYPLGSTPLLASEMTLEPVGDDGYRLILREGRERSFTLNINGELIQALCSMLRAGAENARWDLALDYATGKQVEANAPPAESKPAKTLLH